MDMVVLLIAKGAVVNAKNHVGLYMDCKWTNVKIGLITALLQSGSTPLHYAASGAHVEIAELLIENDANVNARDKVSRP